MTIYEALKIGEEKMKKTLFLSTLFAVTLLTSLTVVLVAESQCSEWSEPEQLTTDPAYNYYPSIMQDQTSKIWLVWARGQPANLMYKTSIDGGASWSNEQILVLNAGYVFGTTLLQDSTGRIWVAWADTLGSCDIFYITSDDDGLSWSSKKQLTTHPSCDVNPSLIQISNEIWIVYHSQNNIYYKKTSDSGVNWSNDIQVTSDSLYESSPDALVDSTGKVWIVWQRNHNIYYKTSIDSGASWSSAQQLTTDPAIEQMSSIIEDTIGRIIIFYDSVIEPSAPNVWYKVSKDSGNTWSSRRELTYENLNDQVPYSALINSEIWVVWHSLGRTESGDIWVSKAITPVIPATIEVNPQTLNLKSKGKWVTCYIELLDGYDTADIDISTILLNGTIPAEMHPTGFGDYDEDGIPDLMVKFDRCKVISLIANNINSEAKFSSTTLTITGKLKADTPFMGSDTIRVKGPLPK